LQYDGTWGTGLSVAKINYYGNQSASWVWEGDTVDDAHTNSIQFTLWCFFYLFCGTILVLIL
jgi:hypothetical protein